MPTGAKNNILNTQGGNINTSSSKNKQVLFVAFFFFFFAFFAVLTRERHSNFVSVSDGQGCSLLFQVRICRDRSDKQKQTEEPRLESLEAATAQRLRSKLHVKQNLGRLYSWGAHSASSSEAHPPPLLWGSSANSFCGGSLLQLLAFFMFLQDWAVFLNRLYVMKSQAVWDHEDTTQSLSSSLLWIFSLILSTIQDVGMFNMLCFIFLSLIVL